MREISLKTISSKIVPMKILNEQDKEDLMSIKELIFSLTGVEVNTENLADLKANPSYYTNSKEEAELLTELFFLLDQTEESEELQ